MFLRNRAKCHIEQEKYAQGIDDLMMANQITDGKDPQVLYELGITHFLDKKYRKCLKFLKAALHTDQPNFATADINSQEIRDKLKMN